MPTWPRPWACPSNALPEGRVWQRDRAYFLRDLFMNKVFREKGLVTRASNAGKQHQRRKAMVLAAGFLSVVILGLLTWFGTHSLSQSLGAHRDYWMAGAEDNNWSTESGKSYWKPVVSPEGTAISTLAERRWPLDGARGARSSSKASWSTESGSPYGSRGSSAWPLAWGRT